MTRAVLLTILCAGLAVSACKPRGGAQDVTLPPPSTDAAAAPTGPIPPPGPGPTVQLSAATRDVLLEMIYDQARAELDHLGAKPAILPHSDQDLVCANGVDCGQYPEVINCTAPGLSPCTFAFEAGPGFYIEVATAGDPDRRVSAIRIITGEELRDGIARRMMAP